MELSTGSTTNFYRQGQNVQRPPAFHVQPTEQTLGSSPMDPTQVTLGDRAVALCKKLGIPESAVRSARADASQIFEQADWLVFEGTTPDGITLRLFCGPNMPHYVGTFRPVSS